MSERCPNLHKWRWQFTPALSIPDGAHTDTGSHDGLTWQRVSCRDQDAVFVASKPRSRPERRQLAAVWAVVDGTYRFPPLRCRFEIPAIDGANSRRLQLCCAASHVEPDRRGIAVLTAYVGRRRILCRRVSACTSTDYRLRARTPSADCLRGFGDCWIDTDGTIKQRYEYWRLCR